GGTTEHTHGITSTLLSTLAIRSGEIRDSLLLRRTEQDVMAAELAAVPLG
ncbi:lysine/ornithine N-monooxygenase, partial [Streptomyces eurocidicus]|nr:lysine/ornithine N-monooxygenase [Streptomyces eurocidicus]